MASLAVLGAIYLVNRDSSQGMKNPVAMQSTKPEEKSSRTEAVQKKQAALAILHEKFRKATDFRKLATPAKFRNSQPLRKLPALRKFSATVYLSCNFYLFNFFVTF